MDETRSHTKPLELSKKETVLAWVRVTAAETQRGQVRKTSGRKTVKCGNNADEASQTTPKLWSVWVEESEVPWKYPSETIQVTVG